MVKFSDTDNARDLELGKFSSDDNDDIVIRTISGRIGFLEGVNYDRVDRVAVSPSIEQYDYSLNSVSQVVIEISYTSAARTDIIYARKI